YNNLGLALHGQDRYEEAIVQYQRAIAFKPDYAQAYYNLGNSCADRGAHAMAVQSYHQALHLGLNVADIHASLGHALSQQGMADQALASYQTAINIDPDLSEAHVGLATTYKTLGRYPEAIEHYQRAQHLRPNDSGIGHMLAAVGGAPTPTTADPDYVAKLFDHYADRFDKNLVEDLEYRTPEHINLAIRRVIDAPDTQMDVIDLGCGTGLCGPLLRDLARTLTGVDLSAKMVEKARARGVYDDLVVADIITALQMRDTAYDLIVAADVFVYVGELGPTFNACNAAMKPGGLFVFSVEAAEEDASYVLRSTGRYAHAVGYIRRLAERTGMQEVSLGDVVLRKESGQPMAGHVFVLRKPF
ncbi:MAG: class I SAM-dependent DNA methyltransferase, partial [Gammaproteobacteria bacterium]